MAIEGFSPPPPTPSPYYQLLERGSARLGYVKKFQPIFMARSMIFVPQIHATW